jgi:CrcB protein
MTNLSLANLLWVGLGGAVGSAARYLVWTVVAPRSAGFPWATFAVNLSGSFFLGFLAGILAGRLDPVVRFAVFFGVLGGYTTFSTFAVDTVELVRVGEWVPALSSVTLSVILGIAAAGLGILAGEALNTSM